MSGCDRHRLDIPALLSGELDNASAERLRAHLERCPGCRKEVEELRQVVGLLAPAPLSEQPPAALEDRVLGRVAGADDGPQPAHPGHRAGAAAPSSPAPADRWSRAARALAPALAAAAVVLGLLAWNFRQEARDLAARLEGERIEAGTVVEEIRFRGPSAASATGELRETSDGNYRLVVWAKGLERTDESEYYEVWLSSDRGWLSAGSFGVEGEPVEVVWDCPVGVDPESYSKLWITLEPNDGDPRPTGHEVMQASI